VERAGLGLSQDRARREGPRKACARAEAVAVQSPRLLLLPPAGHGGRAGVAAVAEMSELLNRVPEAGALLLEFARQQAQEGRPRLAAAALSAFPEDDQPRRLRHHSRARA